MRTPEALLLADDLEQTRPHIAAAMLRQQHALIGELVEALGILTTHCRRMGFDTREEEPLLQGAEALIAKTKERQS